MKQYIDKDALVAWIKEKKIPFKKDIDDGVYPTYLCALMDFEDFLDTLEIKEVEEKQAEQKLPIEKLPEEMKTIVESLGFTSQEICDKYNQMVSDLIMSDDDKGEQKPTDKAKPKFRVKYAGSEYNVFETKDITGVTLYGIEDEPNHIDYVKADNCEIISVYAIKENGSPYPTKPAVFSEKKPKRMISAEAKEAMYDKPAWSEEDEKQLNDII